MKRLDINCIVLTNREARDLMQALLAGAEAASQLATDRAELEKSEGEDFASEAASNLANRLNSWQRRIHKVWTSF